MQSLTTFILYYGVCKIWYWFRHLPLQLPHGKECRFVTIQYHFCKNKLIFKLFSKLSSLLTVPTSVVNQTIL